MLTRSFSCGVQQGVCFNLLDLRHFVEGIPIGPEPKINSAQSERTDVVLDDNHGGPLVPTGHNVAPGGQCAVRLWDIEAVPGKVANS